MSDANDDDGYGVILKCGLFSLLFIVHTGMAQGLFQMYGVWHDAEYENL